MDKIAHWIFKVKCPKNACVAFSKPELCKHSIKNGYKINELILENRLLKKIVEAAMKYEDCQTKEWHELSNVISEYRKRII